MLRFDPLCDDEEKGIVSFISKTREFRPQRVSDEARSRLVSQLQSSEGLIASVQLSSRERRESFESHSDV